MALEYGQFCPVAKAAELLGEKWTLLIVRELVCGSTRFSEFQRGLPKISPTLLTRRLNGLCEAGIIMRKRIPGRRGHEYHLTESGLELKQIIETLGVWGMRWARGTMSESELDVEPLMWDIQRNLDTSKLIGPQTVLRFDFTDADDFAQWWIVAKGDDVDLCVDDPGEEVDVYFITDSQTLIEVWLGDISMSAARRSGRVKLHGHRLLLRNLSEWFRLSHFADVERDLRGRTTTGSA